MHSSTGGFWIVKREREGNETENKGRTSELDKILGRKKGAERGRGGV